MACFNISVNLLCRQFFNSNLFSVLTNHGQQRPTTTTKIYIQNPRRALPTLYGITYLFALQFVCKLLSILNFSVNGVPACANHDLLTEKLRAEWGFKGYVVSDEVALENILFTHNYTTSLVDTAAVSVKAGCNLELSGGGMGPAVYEKIGRVCKLFCSLCKIHLKSIPGIKRKAFNVPKRTTTQNVV